jgi:hypothetical protein
MAVAKAGIGDKEGSAYFPFRTTEQTISRA